MDKRNRLLVLLALAAIAILSTNSIGDFDTGYHLQTGAFILAQHVIPTHDIFSYTAPGALWIDHYWLADVFFALMYKAGQYVGLIWFVALISALTYLLVLATTFLKTNNVPLATVAIIPYGILTYELWVVRPEIFTFFFAALVIFIFEYWRKHRNPRLLLLLPVVMIIWANMHAGVVLGLCIILLYLAYVLVFGESGDRRRLSLVAALSIAASFLNPNGYRTLAYSFIIGPTTQALGVEEWKSLLSFLGEWQADAFLAIMVLVALFSGYVLLRNQDGDWRAPKDIDWPSLGLLAAAVIMPLVSIRHVAFFPIMTFPIFISCLDERFSERFSGSMAISRGRVFAGVATVLVVFMVCGVLRFRALPTVNAESLPVDAAAFIKNQALAGPMFNDEAFGGYLIWTGWPQQKVFIDGRDEVYSGAVADDYIAIMETAPGWEALVNDKYHINYFLLWYRAPLAGLVQDLSEKLEQELGFKLVYWDDVAIILVRDDAQNKNVIAQFGYDYISPFVPADTIPMVDRPAAAAEWERALAESSSTASILQNYIQ